MKLKYGFVSFGVFFLLLLATFIPAILLQNNSMAFETALEQEEK